MAIFKLDDDLIKEKNLKVRCSKCGNIFKIHLSVSQKKTHQFSEKSVDARIDRSLPIPTKVENILKSARTLLHYKEIEQNIYDIYKCNHSVNGTANNNPNVIRILPGVFIYKDNFDEQFKQVFNSQKAEIEKLVVDKVKSTSEPVSIEIFSKLLAKSEKFTLFSKKSIESLIASTPQIDADLLIIADPTNTKKRSLVWKLNYHANKKAETIKGFLTSPEKKQPRNKRLRKFYNITPQTELSEEIIKNMMKSGNLKEQISAELWFSWTKLLKSNDSDLVWLRLIEIADELGLVWPYTRREEKLSDYLHLTLDQIFKRRGLGKNKGRVLILCVAKRVMDVSKYGTKDEPEKKYGLQQTKLDENQFFASLQKSIYPQHRISEVLWRTWTARLYSSNFALSKIADIASDLGLPWPYVRKKERLSDYLHLDLNRIQRSKGFGKNKVRTLILCIAKAAIDKQRYEDTHNINHLESTSISTDIFSHASFSESTPFFEQIVKKVLKEPPTEKSLMILPLFSSKSLEFISESDLHEDFKAKFELSDILLPDRILKLISKMEYRFVGQILLSRSSLLIEHNNFGRKSLKELHGLIRNIVLERSTGESNSRIDYSSYTSLVESYLSCCIKDQRNQKMCLIKLLPSGKNLSSLVEIGEKFSITRERTRQILQKEYHKLKHRMNIDILDHFWEQIERIILCGGGLISLGELATALKDVFEWSEPPNPTALGQLLSLCKPTWALTDSENLLTLDCECLSCEFPLEMFSSLDFEENESFHIQVVGKHLTKHCQVKCFSRTPQKFHKAYIEKIVERTNGQYIIHNDLVLPYSRWSLRHSSTLGYLAKNVLEKHGSPMHFTNIANIIRKDYSNHKDRSDNSFHSALQRYDDIELIARGTFGLKCWEMAGYRPAYRAIEDLLDGSDFPLSRAQIIQKLDGEFTGGNISIALSNKTRFTCIGEGFYDRAENWQKRSRDGFIKHLPNPVADFVRYLVSNNKYSYKLVMTLIFIRGMDKSGSIPLNRLNKRFLNFYLTRKKRGSVVEAESAVVSRIDELEPTLIINRATKEPLKCFILSGYFSQRGADLQLREDLVPLLTDSTFKDIVIITLLKVMDNYFGRIEPSKLYGEHSVSNKTEEQYLDVSSNLTEETEDFIGDNWPSITIKKKGKSRIKL